MGVPRGELKPNLQSASGAETAAPDRLEVSQGGVNCAGRRRNPAVVTRHSPWRPPERAPRQWSRARMQKAHVWVWSAHTHSVCSSTAHSLRLCAPDQTDQRTASGCALQTRRASAQPSAVRSRPRRASAQPSAVRSGPDGPAHSLRLCAPDQTGQRTAFGCAIRTSAQPSARSGAPRPDGECAFCALVHQSESPAGYYSTPH